MFNFVLFVAFAVFTRFTRSISTTCDVNTTIDAACLQWNVCENTAVNNTIVISNLTKELSTCRMNAITCEYSRRSMEYNLTRDNIYLNKCRHDSAAYNVRWHGCLERANLLLSNLTTCWNNGVVLKSDLATCKSDLSVCKSDLVINSSALASCQVWYQYMSDLVASAGARVLNSSNYINTLETAVFDLRQELAATDAKMRSVDEERVKYRTGGIVLLSVAVTILVLVIILYFRPKRRESNHHISLSEIDKMSNDNL